MDKIFSTSKLFISVIILFLSFTKTVTAQSILFQDNFEQDSGLQWNIVSGNWARQYVQNSYRYGMILNTGSTITESQAGSFNWTNYEFSFDMLPVSGADRNVFFRVNNQKSTCCSWYDYSVSYGLHMYPNHLWLEKRTATGGSELISTSITLSDNEVTHFRIRLEDNHIQVFLNNETIPAVNYFDNENAILTGRIALSVGTGASYPTEVWFDNVKVISIDPPQPPVSKVVFVPGFGASWNADAFASCSFDNDPTRWSLASYAEDVYNPILTTLSESNWQVIPFYYDWRQQIPSNSNTLSDKINSSTVSDEKVNIVSHSMGGLVASDYLANHDQGTKTNSLLAVGSPLKGAVQAYPAWAGGDIWEDNFISKVATTLYLKHCGLLLSNREAIHQFVPSVQNLLPTFDYLRDSKTGILKSTPSLLSQNRWLPLIFVNDFWGVKFGTLTGNGQDTLSEILTKGKTKKDLLANWSDGKPQEKIYSNEGDGTVLLESSKFDDEHNTTIAQTHSGLVNSADGMAEILKFLETPLSDIGSSASADPQSALVIISYPSNLLVTDQDGNTKKDKDGMVAFTNPKSGSYKLKLLPKSNNSLLIVAQFLPNGDVKYKEYNFKGFGPKFKTLKFDLQNPQEDILIP